MLKNLKTRFDVIIHDKQSRTELLGWGSAVLLIVTSVLSYTAFSRWDTSRISNTLLISAIVAHLYYLTKRKFWQPVYLFAIPALALVITMVVVFIYRTLFT